ncbi:MAG: polyprenyl diphosphate synthase, partial [bacterium]
MNEEQKIPQCIGVIMDGNRRWAKEQGLVGTAGHLAGYEKLKEFLGWVNEVGIKYVIAYAFSTENWKRDPGEVEFLMNIFRTALEQSLSEFKKNGVRLKIIGDKSRLPKDLQEKIDKAEDETKGGEVCLVLAISYGGLAEILSAVKKLVAENSPEEIQKMEEKDFGNYMWTKDIPDPDLII